MSWVALERAIRIAVARPFPADLTRWTSARDKIFGEIMTQGWSEEKQAFVQAYGTDVLDASVLLMPLVHLISPTDPRWLSTLDAMTRELVADSLVYRYNVGASPDGLEGEEGTFSICTFWYVEALARAAASGRRRSRSRYSHCSNHLDLYAEQIGLTAGAGSFPQAFTHLAIIAPGTTSTPLCCADRSPFRFPARREQC
jgi:GH15 family glucan-1,4-alpha-glucosidase